MFTADPTRVKARSTEFQLNKLIEPINQKLKTKLVFDSFWYSFDGRYGSNLRNKSNQKRIRLNTGAMMEQIKINPSYLETKIKELYTTKLK